ncbi:hypothetical protein [Mycobacterium sp. 236(2023)]|uniref:hypothetical protein n=1 Tax=Mycobacterium sp. 236(2023) TaxID=3038163 RepID=UPI0024152820|nr:hypothetical protein [Mycobacterium sp. 236(2023)]MDG4662980.1 hypothetical protein [Mycobacterium sp. 236(2023)]
MTHLQPANDPLIAVVHTTPASIAPTAAALRGQMPGVRVWNLLDDRLGSDADAVGDMPPSLRHRMLNLVRHGVDGGADAVLMVCSMYGDTRPVAEKLFTVPIFSSDADMMAEVAARAPKRVAVLASLRAATADSTTRLRMAVGGDVEVVPAFCAGAAEAASAGDRAALIDAVIAGVDAAGGNFDMLCVAQYSMSSVADEVAAKTGLPTVSPPRYAARAIARRLGTG